MDSSEPTKPDLATRQAEIDAMRAEMAADRRRAVENRLGRATTPTEIMVAGIFGTAVAGGLYPGALFVLDRFARNTFVAADPERDAVGSAFAILAFGFVIGVVYAGSVGAFVFSAVGGCAVFCGLTRNYIYAASFAGGATGMLSTVPISGDFLPHRHVYFLVATAIVMGQVGAWWAARKCAQAAVLPFAQHEPVPHTEVIFSLGQLFRITTVVCVVAAVLAALNLSQRTYNLLGFGLAVQVATFAAILLVRRLPSAAYGRNQRGNEL